MQPIYSIIIPHKNIPDLLQRCLDSIPQRDDVQVIIVDDNSDPEKVDFEHFPGLNRPNTEVYFDKTGRGAGRARNVGLEHAKGEWVTFADCDDTYITEEFDLLLSKIYKCNYNVIFWGALRFYTDGSKDIYTLGIGNNKELNCITDHTYMYYVNEPWRKISKLEHIRRNKLHFDETLASNDIMFAMRLACCTKANQAAIYNGYIYNYIQRENSLVQNSSIRVWKARAWVAMRVNRILIKRNISRRDISGYYLYKIKQHSFGLFLLYLIFDFLIVGKTQFKKDIKGVCLYDEIGCDWHSFISYNMRSHIKIY